MVEDDKHCGKDKKWKRERKFWVEEGLYSVKQSGE